MVWLKGALVPILVSVSVPLPLLVRTTSVLVLLVPTRWLPKATGEELRLMPGWVPVPLTLKLLVTVLPPLLLSVAEIVSVALRAPDAPGVKVKLRVQVLPTARLLVQVLLLREKSLGLVPLAVAPIEVSGTLPVLVTITLCAVEVVLMGWLPKLGLLPRLKAGARAMPVPVRLTVSGVLPALLAMLRLALRLLLALGVKLMLMVQLLDSVVAGRLVGQLSVSLKSLALVPVKLIPLMFNAALPLLVRVTVCVLLVVETT